MVQEKINNCPVCGATNSILENSIQQLDKIHRLKCTFCDCAYFSENNYEKPVYDIDYNMEFFRSGDIRKAGLFAYDIDKILESSPEEKKLLEVGTGNGIFTFLMQSMGYDIKALDIDPKLCNFLEEQMNIRTMTGEFETIEITDKYDLIYASHVIEHVQNPVNFVKKAYACLKEKGLLYLDTPNIDFQEKHGINWHHFNTRNEFEHCCMLSPLTIEHIAKITNFHIIFIEQNKQYESMQVVLRRKN